MVADRFWMRNDGACKCTTPGGPGGSSRRQRPRKRNGGRGGESGSPGRSVEAGNQIMASPFPRFPLIYCTTKNPLPQRCAEEDLGANNHPFHSSFLAAMLRGRNWHLSPTGERPDAVARVSQGLPPPPFWMSRHEDVPSVYVGYPNQRSRDRFQPLEKRLPVDRLKRRIFREEHVVITGKSRVIQ